MARYNILKALTGRRNKRMARKVGRAALYEFSGDPRVQAATQLANAAFSGSGAYRRKVSRKRTAYRQRRARQGNVGALRRTGNVWSISHREYISEIYALSGQQINSSLMDGITFGLSSTLSGGTDDIMLTECMDTGLQSVGAAVLINPADNVYFPWLSTIARNFQKYRFKKLIFHFKTITSEATANTSGLATSLGTMLMGANYDPVVKYEGSGSQPQVNAFQSMSEMLNSDGALQAKVSKSMSFGIECSKSGNAYKWYMILPNGKKPIVGTDSRIWYQAMFQMAAADVPTANGVSTDLGQLWVEYECEFMNPVISAYTDHLQNGSLESTAYITYDAAATAASVDTFGTPTTAALGSNVVIDFPSANNLTLKGLLPGVYMFEHEFNFTSTTTAVAPAITFSLDGDALTNSIGVATPTTAVVDLRSPAADSSTRHVCKRPFVIKNKQSGTYGQEVNILFTYAKSVNVDTAWTRIYRLPDNANDYLAV